MTTQTPDQTARILAAIEAEAEMVAAYDRRLAADPIFAEAEALDEARRLARIAYSDAIPADE